MKAISRISALLAVAVLAASCTMKNQEAPPLTGPAEFGTSVTLEASPDVLQTDGGSQSLITITTRDSNGKPLPNVSLRTEIRVDGQPIDFGTISARNVVTDSNGRATVRYTAPNILGGVDTGAHVEIVATPLGANAGNAVPRGTNIRLVPVGVVIPPDGLNPAFTFTPSSPTDNQTVVFDASSSSAPANNPIVSYSWNFGDGDIATGVTAQHSFDEPGAYPVVLTVRDAFGRSASTTRTVQVGAGVRPTASATFSPGAPLAFQQVLFNASGSQPAPGRRIVSYDWSFGDGATGSGVETSHAYAASGDYTVVLVVTDDAGRTASTSLTVRVGADKPTASFTFSPTTPTPGQLVTFNASGSQSLPGRTIVSYHWDFGDGTSGSGQNTSHTYALEGNYVVTLTVTDDRGATGITTRTVPVKIPE